jgi:hypothetical protein
MRPTIGQACVIGKLAQRDPAILIALMALTVGGDVGLLGKAEGAALSRRTDERAGSARRRKALRFAVLSRSHPTKQRRDPTAEDFARAFRHP